MVFAYINVPHRCRVVFFCLLAVPRRCVAECLAGQIVQSGLELISLVVDVFYC